MISRWNFNPRAPRGARLHAVNPRSASLGFQSTRPARGATLASRYASYSAVKYFNPRAPRGARLRRGAGLGAGLLFQSTRPARGATNAAIDKVKEAIFQSTRPARGATPNHGVDFPNLRISIHAPREGRDFSGCPASCSSVDFNPRAPRGARRHSHPVVPPSPYFNPRAPRGARPGRFSVYLWFFCISIHAPREGRDSKSEQISLHIFAKKAMSSDVFGAKRRLLKRFSAYNTGKPF